MAALTNGEWKERAAEGLDVFCVWAHFSTATPGLHGWRTETTCFADFDEADAHAKAEAGKRGWRSSLVWKIAGDGASPKGAPVKALARYSRKALERVS